MFCGDVTVLKDIDRIESKHNLFYFVYKNLTGKHLDSGYQGNIADLTWMKRVKRQENKLAKEIELIRKKYIF